MQRSSWDTGHWELGNLRHLHLLLPTVDFLQEGFQDLLHRTVMLSFNRRDQVFVSSIFELREDFLGHDKRATLRQMRGLA